VTTRALTFGSVAPLYERFRLGYPEELVDVVLAFAERPIRTALEIGAGTGKASRAFAARGVAVTATDPDPAMLAELRTHVPASVVTVRASLEELPLTTAYDLVFVAAALHWTDPVHRWSRIAALVRTGGVFASFGGQVQLTDLGVRERVHAARSAFITDDAVPSPDGTPCDSAMQWPGTELLDSEDFTDVRERTLERRLTMSAADYVGHLSTVSAYLQLPAGARSDVLGRIRAVLPDEVSVTAHLDLHLARRADAD
jgi:SAM-dependent methyltransferase